MTRILITGGSSYLGQHLVPKAIEQHSCLYTFFSHDPLGLPGGTWLDVRDGKSVDQLVNEFRPEAIIHTAGSNRSEDMEQVIVQGASNISTAAMRLASRLVHISTDVIFDGKAGPYRETDVPQPVHAYGRAKVVAERKISRHGDHAIIRTSLIYGLQRMDLSTRWIIDALEANEPVTLFTDQVRNPVWVETLADACIELCQSPFKGIINVAGGQDLTRAELGVRLLDWWGFDRRELLSLGKSDPRWPRDCRLDLSLARSTLRTPLPGVDEVIQMPGNRKTT